MKDALVADLQKLAFLLQREPAACTDGVELGEVRVHLLLQGPVAVVRVGMVVVAD